MNRRILLVGGVLLAAGIAAGLWLTVAREAAPVATTSGVQAKAPEVDPRRHKPQAIKRTAPVIPESLRLADRAAAITARVTIRPDGTVSDVSIISSDIPEANDVVVRACREWLFEPSGVEQETMYHTRVPARRP